MDTTCACSDAWAQRPTVYASARHSPSRVSARVVTLQSLATHRHNLRQAARGEEHRHRGNGAEPFAGHLVDEWQVLLIQRIVACAY